MADRTPAERSVDRLSAELRKLRALPKPSIQQRNRMFELEVKLTAAWRAVYAVRDRER